MASATATIYVCRYPATQPPIQMTPRLCVKVAVRAQPPPNTVKPQAPPVVVSHETCVGFSMLSSVHEQMSSEQSPRTGVYRPAGALHNELSVGRAPSLALRSRPPSVIVQAGAAAQHMAEARYLALPSAADWRPIPGKRTPRSLRPIYTAESRRREISALTAEVASPQSNSSSWHHEGQAQGKS